MAGNKPTHPARNTPENLTKCAKKQSASQINEVANTATSAQHNTHNYTHSLLTTVRQILKSFCHKPILARVLA
jgi:hypothetical protein